MKKRQNWKIPLGHIYKNQCVNDIVSDSSDLQLLLHDGYSGKKYLQISNKTVWEEIYSWKDGDRYVTTVKLTNIVYHRGRILFVSHINYLDKKAEIHLVNLNHDWVQKIKKERYEILFQENTYCGYINTLEKSFNNCLLTLNGLNIPFGHNKQMYSPSGLMQLLQENNVLKSSFLDIYWMNNDFSITRKNIKEI
jgi:hypothetical protein